MSFQHAPRAAQAKVGIINTITHIWLVLAFSHVPCVCAAADLWVDRNSIGGPCADSRFRIEVSESSPWCTLAAIRDNLYPGDVVHVREGEYTEIFRCSNCWSLAVLQLTASGTPDAPIKIIAHEGENVVISAAGGATWGILVHEDKGNRPRHIAISGLKVRAMKHFGVLVSGTSDIVLSDLDVSGSMGQAIGVHKSSRVTVEGCRVHHNPLGGWTSAINLWKCKDGNVVRGNFVWANTDEDKRESEGHGIIVDWGEESGDTLIENNVVWDNEGHCINIFFSNGVTIRNNTCWQNGLGRSGAGSVWIRGENISVYNNILVSRHGSQSLVFADTSESSIDWSTVRSDHNIVWSEGYQDIVTWPRWKTGSLEEHQEGNPRGWDAHSLQVDPQLAGVKNDDFSPNCASPAIDSGLNAQSPYSDALGHKRPEDGDRNGIATVDRGAIEFTPENGDLTDVRSHKSCNNDNRDQKK